ncbi:M81 family metallopeptidase [Mesorhizobium sp. M0166]
MVAETYGGEIRDRLREIFGPFMPTVVTLELHANVTEKMAANA